MLTALEEAVRSLFDSGGAPAPAFSVHVSRAAPEALAECTVAEAREVARAVPARQWEFATGRLVARRALADLGIGAVEIPRDPRTRAPVWPSGIVGSITHSDGLCAAVCANADGWTSVGLDLEPDAPLEDELRPIICTEAELSALSGPDSAQRLRWTFSAKEAFYKAQHPLTQRFLDFTDVELDWHPESTPTRARYEARCSVPEGAAVAVRGAGRLVVVDGWVFTSFVVSDDG